MTTSLKSSVSQTQSQLPPKSPWRNLSLRLISTCACLVLAYFFSYHLFVNRIGRVSPTLATWTHRPIQAPRENVWAQLTKEEAADVKEFLLVGPSNLNLTAPENATSWNDFIYSMELLRPNKSDILPYLNGDSNAPPSRWARVTTYSGSQPEQYLYDYMVGPLPVTKHTQIHPLSYCFNSGRSYSQINYPDWEQVLNWYSESLIQFSDIITSLLRLSDYELRDSNDDDIAMKIMLPSVEDNRIVAWGSFVRNGTYSEASTLLPQGLYVKIDITSRYKKDWTILNWMYNNVVYNSTDELRTMLTLPGFQKTGLNLDGEWTVIEDFGEGQQERELPPPIMVQPLAHRYRLDRKENFISWMGFEFYIAFSHVTGITLYNIHFNGEPIIYELGMQEALAHYAGDDPVQGSLAFLDTQFSMGARMFELVPGYDCPAYASFLDSTLHMEGSTTVIENNICMFEYTSDHALQRHTSRSYISISRNNYFVVRAVSVVGNYDYTFDYIFYLDGSIEVKVRASGYIEGSYWASNRSKDYGYRVHDQFSTSIHDHVLNFKADLDIAGTNNKLVRVAVEPTKVDYDWEKPGPRNTMKLIQEPILNETGLEWLGGPTGMYVVQNHNLTNIWGEKRGYSIRPGTGIGVPTHLTIQNSTTTGRSVEWATKDLWVVQQKDTEPRSSDTTNGLISNDPLIDFSKFVDGESVENEDLVIYFNLGNHHIPHSGDIPNTLMHTSASSVIFAPHNFNDRDSSRINSQGVRINLSERERTRYFGGRYKKDLNVKLNELEPDLNKYGAPQQHERTFL